MRKRRSRYAEDDEEEEDDEGIAPVRRNRRRRNHISADEDDDDEVMEESKEPASAQEKKKKSDQVERDDEDAAPPESKAVPVGEAVKVTGKGRKKKNHFSSFELEGNTYELEDPVLLTPEEIAQKPYVAIIKDITQDVKGDLVIVGQWFYRPEEAERKGGGSWQTRDTRELFYSFHIDEVPAESVMHKCVVHFIPPNKQLPKRKEHPGFIVQKVYDTGERKLFKLTDQDYEESKLHELELLMRKTRDRIGELPDIDHEESPIDTTHLKRSVRRRIEHLDIPKIDDKTSRSDQFVKADTPGSSETLKFRDVLAKYNVLVGVPQRDKWLDKLLLSAGVVYITEEGPAANDSTPASVTAADNISKKNCGKTTMTTQNGVICQAEGIFSPEVAVPILAALERVAHDTLGSDFTKYNQKLRTLDFNLKNGSTLARRLLKKELDPLTVITMTPTELKAGFTTEENPTAEPEESKQLQMTDARCSRCTEQKVGILEIIQAGGQCDRYRLECVKCGHYWYATRDSLSFNTVDSLASADATAAAKAPTATADLPADDGQPNQFGDKAANSDPAAEKTAGS